MNVASHSETPRALITGYNGFTGQYLAAELKAAGYRVFGTSNEGHHASADVSCADLCDREKLKEVVEQVRPDIVAHLAAISYVAHNDAEAIYRTNIVGTRNLLEALTCANKPPRSVLLASSANIYGTSAEVLDESSTPAPSNDYAVSKLAMEYMARQWMDRLPIVIARPFNYTGVGQSEQFLLPKIVGHFKRNDRTIDLGNINVERDFSDVRVVANAYRRLLDQAPAGETFNICSGRTVSIKSILAMMAEISGYAIEVRKNQAFVRADDVRRLQGEGGKLSLAIGPLAPIPLMDTLRWMYASK